MGLVDTFKKAFRDEMRKQSRPHVKTALTNVLFDADIHVDDEILEEMTDEFFFYFRASAKSK